MARLSEYFCEKAHENGLVDVLIVAVNSYQGYPPNEVSYNSIINVAILTLLTSK